MKYKNGDMVVHWNYGPGQITGIEEKQYAGQTRQYYVLKTSQLTLWVPTDEEGEKSMRQPVSRTEFKSFKEILRSESDPLPDDQFQRHSQLTERIRRKSLDDVCRIIRDLTARAQSQKLNRNDTAILKQAQELILGEMQLSLGTSREHVELEFNSLMK